MRHALTCLALASLTLTVGCGGSPPTRTLYTGGGTPGSAPIYRIQSAAGIPNDILGADGGYFITANTGGSFRLVWTGDVNQAPQYHHFTGSVWTEGHFTSLTPGCTLGFCPLEKDDYISVPHVTTGGQRIDWDTFAADGFDGLDFVVDTVPIFIEPYVDDAAQPTLVYFPATDNGGQVSNTGAIPFGLTTQ